MKVQPGNSGEGGCEDVGDGVEIAATGKPVFQDIQGKAVVVDIVPLADKGVAADKGQQRHGKIGAKGGQAASYPAISSGGHDEIEGDGEGANQHG